MTYDADTVTTFLPAIWDDDYLAAPPRKPVKVGVDPALYRVFEPPKGDALRVACEPDRRNGTSDPRSANSAWAELVDVGRGWKSAPLSREERAALFLVFGLGLPQTEAATVEGVSARGLGHRVRRGVNKIRTFLNGFDVEEGAEYADDRDIDER